MRRLYWRVYVHSLGVLLVAGLATSLVFAIGGRGGPVREVAGRLARHAAALAGESFGDHDRLATRVRQLHDDLEVNLAVRDAGGRVVASAGTPLPGLSASDAADVAAGEVVVRVRPRWIAAAPVRDPSGTVVGSLAVSALRRAGSGSLLGPVLGVGLLLLVVAAATAPLARRITRPVERLTEAARQLGGGNLAARVAAAEPRASWRRGRHGPDELAALTRAFNDMAERVERLVRGQRELLANVSHELRSPLARIRVALELLPRDGELDARLRDVDRDLADLDRLIEDVLTASRLEATGLPQHLGAVDGRRLLEEIAARAAHVPLVAGQAVRVADGQAVSFTADEGLLRRALWNLVENAGTYGAPPITLAVTRHGDRVVLSVTDEGGGIAPDERARVLEPFYRGDRARTPGGPGQAARGVGLGLTLARRVAEVHGGDIAIGPGATVDGRERGCRVTITLPASPPATGPTN